METFTPTNFKSRWLAEVVRNDPLPDDVQLITAAAPRLADTRLPESARQFLAEAGLPKSCAPCLTFEEVGKGLPRIWELYSPTEWNAEEKRPVEHYLMIGGDGCGSPVCVDERDGRVVVVDHELFSDPERLAARIQLVNSSIPLLAEALLIVNALPMRMRRDALLILDPPALTKGSFWSYESNITAHPDDLDAALNQKKSWGEKVWETLTRPLKLR
jgi:hypothetical protein